MDMKKIIARILISTYFTLSLCAMLLGYRYFFTPSHEPAEKLPPAHADEPGKPSEFKVDAGSGVEIATANEIVPTTEAEPETGPEAATESSPILSNRIFLLAQQRRLNSETFITRDDLPEALRRELDMALDEYRREGHFAVDEGYIEDMNAPYNAVESFRLDDPALMIAAENLEETSLADMEYIGIIPDRVSDTDGAPVPGIRRVFRHEAGYVSLYEADLKASEALLQKEFVNKSIKGYPATQITYCAPSMRCVTQLSWLTNDKRYELALRGAIKELGEDELVHIANSLDLPPVPQEERKSHLNISSLWFQNLNIPMANNPIRPLSH